MKLRKRIDLQKVLSVKPDTGRPGMKFEIQMKDAKDTIGKFNFQFQIKDKKFHPVMIMGFQWKKNSYSMFRNNIYQSIDLYDIMVPGQLGEARELIKKIYENDRLEISVNYRSTDGGKFVPFTAEIPYRRKVDRLYRYLELAVARGLPLRKPKTKKR